MKFSLFALNYYFYSDYVLDLSRYKSLLHDKRKLRCDMRYPRVAVKHFLCPSFRHLYLSRNEKVLLNATGYDRITYALSVRNFQPYYNYYTINDEIRLIRRTSFVVTALLREDIGICAQYAAYA